MLPLWDQAAAAAALGGANLLSACLACAAWRPACSQVAVRAIEIAKELHSGGRGNGSGGTANATSSAADGSGTTRGGSGSGSVIEAAAVRHEEIVSRQQQASNGTAAAADGPADADLVADA